MIHLELFIRFEYHFLLSKYLFIVSKYLFSIIQTNIYGNLVNFFQSVKWAKLCLRFVDEVLRIGFLNTARSDFAFSFFFAIMPRRGNVR